MVEKDLRGVGEGKRIISDCIVGFFCLYKENSAAKVQRIAWEVRNEGFKIQKTRKSAVKWCPPRNERQASSIIFQQGLSRYYANNTLKGIGHLTR